MLYANNSYVKPLSAAVNESPRLYASAFRSGTPRLAISQDTRRSLHYNAIGATDSVDLSASARDQYANGMRASASSLDGFAERSFSESRFSASGRVSPSFADSTDRFSNSHFGSGNFKPGDQLRQSEDAGVDIVAHDRARWTASGQPMTFRGPQLGPQGVVGEGNRTPGPGMYIPYSAGLHYSPKPMVTTSKGSLPPRVKPEHAAPGSPVHDVEKRRQTLDVKP